MAEELMQEELLEEVESQENKQDEKDLTDAERCLTFESGGLVMYMSTSYVIEIINDHHCSPHGSPLCKGNHQLKRFYPPGCRHSFTDGQRSRGIYL